MILQNNKLIESATSKEEKQRLKSNTNSLLHRLKRRREEEFVKETAQMQAERFEKLFEYLAAQFSEEQQKHLLVSLRSKEQYNPTDLDFEQINFSPGIFKEKLNNYF